MAYYTYGPIPTYQPASAWGPALYYQRTNAVDYYPTASACLTAMHTNRHFDATAAHIAIEDVLRELNGRVRSFDFPHKLDFQPPPANGQIPRLAETRRNAPLKEHRRRLEELLEVLDGIRSYGDEGVRRARADAVEHVEGELYELKRKKAAIWDNELYNRRHRRPFWARW